jgi:hypothetical protein
MFRHRYVSTQTPNSMRASTHSHTQMLNRSARMRGRYALPALARRRAGKAAHTWFNVVTRAVFHAPMFALNALAENACEPSHPRSTPTEGARMCRRGCVGAQSHTHTRARAWTQHVRVCAAGPHRRSVRPCSQPRMDVDTCMHPVSMYYTCVCSIRG